MCRMFSQLQNLGPWTTQKQEAWCEALEHIRFVVELYLDENQLLALPAEIVRPVVRRMLSRAKRGR